MKPIILDYSKERGGAPGIDYSYNQDLNLNVINIEGIVVPFVESGVPNLETTSKTERDREKDDDWNYLLEMVSKTLVARESDDH